MVRRPAWPEPDGYGAEAPIGPESEKQPEGHTNKFRHPFGYNGKPLKGYNEQWSKVIFKGL